MTPPASPSPPASRSSPLPRHDAAPAEAPQPARKPGEAPEARRPKRKRAKRCAGAVACGAPGCRKPPHELLGGCKWCGGGFCCAHRLPEAHGCASIASCREAAFAANAASNGGVECAAPKLARI
jgi:predicted nucleic acid binding AN1-type Zn finger protein